MKFEVYYSVTINASIEVEAENATDALRIVREKSEDFNHVLPESDVTGFEFGCDPEDVYATPQIK